MAVEIIIIVDTKAILSTIRREIKSRVFGKSRYGRHWVIANNEWYEQIHNSNYLLNKDFQNFLQNKKDVKTVLEVGCGTGIFPIKHRNLFEGMSYTGIDISLDAIEYCKKNSNFTFLQGDFIKMELLEKYDLIYSHAVVDHVYDIDAFITKIAKNCKKYAYISSYRGYFATLTNHKMKWNDDDGCYYNDISPNQIKNCLLGIGLQEDEFVIRSQEASKNGNNIMYHTAIEISKKIS
jgi:SAM-dependent methyltransferase